MPGTSAALLGAPALSARAATIWNNLSRPGEPMRRVPRPRLLLCDTGARLDRLDDGMTEKGEARGERS